TRQARARQAPRTGRVPTARPQQPHHRHEGPRATGAPGPRGRRRPRRGRHEERARAPRPGGRHEVTREPDGPTSRDLDWSKDDEELARLIGRPAAIVAEFRRRMISGGDGRRRKWMKPPPEVIALWRDEARDHTVGELTRVWRLTLQGVQRRLKRHGLTAAPPKSRKGHKRVATTETVERWRREAARHPADELARMWGVTERTVFTRAWRHGFTVRARERRTPERVVERWRREAQGRTIAELAALWGVPRSTARGRVRR